MLTEREQFIILADNQRLKKADAIILLTGDGLARIDKAKELLDQGFAPLIVISGNLHRPEQGALLAEVYKEKLLAKGVSEKNILLEDKSLDTREEALYVFEISKQYGWRTLILVTSPYHQYRALLTFISTVKKNKSDITCVNAPARNLSWTRQELHGTRINLLQGEFDRIEEYQKNGDVSSFKEGIDYLLVYDKQFHETR